MPPRPIIIDTDPGQDDAVALLMAMSARDRLKVIGITTCAGNVPLELTTANALQIVELAERTDIAVRSGCPRPIMRPRRGLSCAFWSADTRPCSEATNGRWNGSCAIRDSHSA